jgi:membrane protein
VSTTPGVEPAAPATPGDDAPSGDTAVTGGLRARIGRLRAEGWGLIVQSQRHRVTGLASQFAYNAFIATVPMLLTLIAAVRLIGGEGATSKIVRTYNEEIPSAYQHTLHDVLNSALRDQNRAAAVLGLAVIAAVYLAGNAVGGLIVGLDQARGTPDRPWVVGKVVGMRIAAVWIVLATLVNLAILLGQSGADVWSRRFDLSASTHSTLRGLVFFAGSLVLLAMVWVLYRQGPNAPMRLRRAYLPGMTIAAVGIVAFTQLFALYVDHFGGFSVYGALFGVVIYLTLLWGVGLAVLFGAEVNEAFVRRHGGDVEPPDGEGI